MAILDPSRLGWNGEAALQQASSTLYDYLQVSQHASEGVIRAAYKNLVQQWHPDRHPADREYAELMMLKLNQAYQVLSDEEMRRKYDSFLMQNSDSHTSPVTHPVTGACITGRAFASEALDTSLPSLGQIISIMV